MNYKKLKFIALFFTSVLLTGCFGDSKEIQNAKNIVKNSLLDGESAQFADLNFYEKSNFVCGTVNAKNKMGGYVGKKKFVANLKTSTSYIDPNREIPDSPKPPSYISIESTIDYANRSAAWMSKVDSIQSMGLAFDTMIENGCTNTPPAPKKASIDNKTKDAPTDNFEYSNEVTLIPKNFAGNDLSPISDKVSTITKNKEQIETTDEYNKRMAVLKFDPTPFIFNKKYSIKLVPSTFGMSQHFDYNADKETLAVEYKNICKDDVIYKYKNEKPLVCKANGSINLSISNKSKIFGKLISNRIDYPSLDNPEYDFKDSFKMSRNKLTSLYKSESDKTIQLATLFVGYIVEDQKNPKHTWVENPYLDKTPTTMHAVSGKVVPFEVKNIIHFNLNSGEILDKKEF